ncbi:MerR family DNA-binding transcriptional regulator [Streptomyces bambusae]|nr:MerR family DNA-binding transcriptional regulator [Streptomyces bambusae]
MAEVGEVAWSIGELAERAGVTVKAVRFYSDAGLLPEAGRSGGGHRRYGEPALDRLLLIRSLRTLDLPVSDVGRVLERDDLKDDVLEDVIADRLRDVGSQLTALRWREAALQIVHAAPPGERAERLRLVGAVSAPPSTDVMAGFWRGLLPPRLSVRLRSAIVEAAVPQPPSDPTPQQVLAFARLHALVAEVLPFLASCRPGVRGVEGELHPDVLYGGLGQAYDIAAGELRAGRAPGDGASLDAFVGAHADARGVKDTPGFRLELGQLLDRSSDPFLDRYWDLAAQVAGVPGEAAEPNMGAAHGWLRAALERGTEVGPEGFRAGGEA